MERDGDLRYAASRQHDVGETLMHVEELIEALSLRLQQGVQDCGSDVGQRRVLRERQHWQRQPVSRAEQPVWQPASGAESDSQTGDVGFT